MAVNNTVNSPEGKLVNKTLRYAILAGWFFSLFVAITTTGLVTYFKVIKARLMPAVTNSPTPTPIASPITLVIPDLTTLLSEAKNELQSGNTQVAIEKLLEAIKLDSNNAEIYKTYADALVAANRYPEAIENYQKAIELNKEDLEIYSKLAKASEQIGQDDKAITAYTTALTVKNDANLRLQLARVLVRNNRPDEARKNYDQVVKGEDPALANLARQELAKLNDERIASSKPIKPTPLPSPSLKPTPLLTPTPLPSPVKVEPVRIETPKPVPVPTEPVLRASDYMERGIKLLNVKDYNAALREFEKMLKADPNNLGAHYLIGQCQYGLGNSTAALNSFRRCAPPVWNGIYSGACQGQVKKVEKELKK
ncbi:MAG: tetratricopeptide repeat protein [Acidobacteria bacterium]|nr:tetratricopeptide repeat protein [Acidobacteriota bacterium]